MAPHIRASDCVWVEPGEPAAHGSLIALRELGISQDAISRLEQRSDLLPSTLRRTVEAMGGSLSLIARFPDRPPVEVSGIGGRKTGD